MSFKHILIGEAVALDEAGNVVFLDGDAHETISAHCGAQFEAAGHGGFHPCAFCKVARWFVEDVLGSIWPHLHGHFARAWAAEKAVYVASKTLPGG